MKKTCKILIVLLLCLPFFAGCVKLALQLSPSLIPNLTQALFEECDIDIARLSMPADLKLIEGLLKNDPENKQLLTTLCMGFTGYTMLFIEEEDPERASKLYLRARNYGFKALGLMIDKDNILNRLTNINNRELQALFWTTMSWNAWINLNLDKPIAIAQLSIAQACLEKVLEINPDYFYGTPYILMGSILASKPALLGGNKEKARECFEKAINLNNGKFFLAQYYFAKYYAVRIQNKDLFFKLIKDIDSTDPYELKEACLINVVMKQKTKRLMKMSDELFL
jgi:tetratricopeptide (TPR) repeat protein